MELSGYISLQSFVEGCTGPAGEPALILQAENLLYTVPEEEYQYGLSLLRKAIGEYEVQKVSLWKAVNRLFLFFVKSAGC